MEILLYSGTQELFTISMDVPFGHFNTNKTEYNKEFIFSSFVGDSPSSFLQRAWSRGFDGRSLVIMLYHASSLAMLILLIMLLF